MNAEPNPTQESNPTANAQGASVERVRLPDGKLDPGQAPEAWGFTPERFTAGAFGSYLWVDGERLLVSMIQATKEGRGYFSQLVKAAEADGYRVEVPTPFPHMQAILIRWGFTPREESAPEFGPGVTCTVWSRPT